MKSKRILNVLIALCLAMSVSAIASEPATEKDAQADDKKAPLESLRQFAEVFSRIKQSYVEEVDNDELIEYAIRGMLEGLDPHSDFVVEEDYDELQENTKGEFGGLGIEVAMEDGFVKVIAPMDDTPAEKAGVKAGDLIIRLDDKPVKGMTLNDAVDVMRGEPGSVLTLTILRDGVEAPLTIEIERAIIRVASVKTRLLEDAYGYVRISNFQTHTAQDLIKRVDELKEESDGPLKGMILDLRNNPGGVLNAAVAVSDAFIGKGEIVYTEGRTDDSNSRYAAKPDDIIDGAPLVVLINEGSASASEIVAGALQDHHRAVLVGRTSFGKGSVQTVIPVDEKSAVKITTARYFTPKGRSIQAEGIVPDIILERVTVELKEKALQSVKEAALSGHLSNPNGDSEESHEAKESDDSEEETDKEAEPEAGDESESEEKSVLITEDYFLNEALNLLKGLYILSLRETD